MKDAKHHLKQIQKKVMKSAKKEPVAQPQQNFKAASFIRPKTVLNKRKYA